MPSIRKRIGYLPSLDIQKIITTISKKESLSQSKVVGILVEEALRARGVYEHQITTDLIRKSIYSKEGHINNSSFNNNDVDELISDKGITYNKNKYNHLYDDFSSETRESSNEDLFEHFKQFILFQKMLKEKQ